MRSVNVWGGVAVATLAIAGAGCSPVAWGIAGGAAAVCAYAPSRFNHAYHAQYQRPGVRTLPSETADVRIGFVEFDDFGCMRDTLQARAILDTIQSLRATRNVALVVYVHGWRHNAKGSDGDVASFEATLKHLGQELDDPGLRRARETLTGDAGLIVLGIYVGWRGKSWPELGRHVPYLGPAVLDVPVYLTSPGRKTTAGVVGGGDLKGFLLRLDDMHREINLEARRNARETKPLGLVYVGHSYGGHIVFTALAGRIEDQMGTSIGAGTARDPSGLSPRVYPVVGDHTTLPDTTLVDGVGDLVVLVNPAIEASAYRRIDHMVRSTTFSPHQLPRMVTLSAENDAARGFLFGVMRFLQLFGRARTRRQNELETNALGSFEAQVTHQMELTHPGDAATRERARRRVIENGRDQLSARRVVSAVPPPAESGATERIFAKHEHGVVRLRSNDGGSDPRPALVARSSRQVIDKHSDFFRAEFIDWLTDYVLAIERVRLSNAAAAAAQAETSRGTAP